MTRKVVWMFSGQGSQYRGMGRELYDHDPVFRESLERCDRIVRPWLGVSLIEAIYGADRPGASGALEDTRVTHPAISAVQYAVARTLQERGCLPDILLGYSLGEFVAQLVAGAISLETALELLHRHASLMEAATSEGGMLAVLEKPVTLQPIMRELPGLWLAAHNFENHCVVSGAPRSLDELQRRLEGAGSTVQRLPVRRAFHSPLMDGAEAEFRAHLSAVRARPASGEIRSAATGGAKAEGVGGLWSATRERVDFFAAICRLEREHPEGLNYLDMGPSGTLATFVKYIGVRPESRCFPTITQWGGARKNLQAYEEAE